MKFRNYLLASFGLLAMTACSEDEVMDNRPDEPTGDAYLSLSIEMPNLGTQTRSIDENGNKHEGTVDEQMVSELLVIAYDAQGTTAKYQHLYKGSDLRPTAPNAHTDEKITVYTVPAFQVESGEKKVLVIVNPLGSKFDVNTASAAMGEVTTLTQEEITAISSKNKFMMTNVNRTENSDGLVSVNVTGTQTHPTPVTVEVERVVAKIEDQSTTYNFTVEGHAGDQVHFTDVALINGNTKFYPIKKVRANVAAPTNDYIVDPNFESQSDATAADFYSKAFDAGFGNADIISKQLGNQQGKACFYTLENTMIEGEQKNGYTTGLYYKATYTLNGQTEGNNVYLYAGKLYSWTTLEAAAKELGLNLQIDQNKPDGNGTVKIPLTDDSTQDEFDAVGVKKYEKGVCYYPYWIRHINNGHNTQMGPMEFAVVRNNYYQMTLHSVKEIGEYKPVTPGTQIPDENGDTYLDVKVKVLPWIVRNNQIDF
ncbi:hypothetical protein, secreted [gut metagenome]|uniref:Minor fimbrium subunit Mfa1 C-terminal domain-containing protein n=1 Tax=gut metagenome TaxID=749906 RepID=J9GBL1_9ZZZZ